MIKMQRKWRALCAIVMWLLSGAKVLSIGISAYGKGLDATEQIIWFGVALVFFTGIVFPRAIPPNVSYLEERPEPMPFYHCIRPKTWLIAAFMMSLGIGLRLSKLTSEEFIVGFYLGLGFSLMLCVRFYIKALLQFFSED